MARFSRLLQLLTGKLDVSCILYYRRSFSTFGPRRIRAFLPSSSHFKQIWYQIPSGKNNDENDGSNLSGISFFMAAIFAVPVLAILSPTLLAGENDEDISINNSTPVCLPERNANGKFSRVPSSLKFQQMGSVRSAKRKLDFNKKTDENFQFH